MKLRKGMTREKLIKDMSDEQWEFIDKVQDADERKVKNELAYKLLLVSEQGMVHMKQVKSEVNKSIVTLYQTCNEIRKHKVAIESGHVGDKHSDGKTKDELETEIMYAEFLIEGILNQIRIGCSQLYSFVGTMKLDRTIKISEEEYNEFVKDIESKVAKKGYSLF